MRKLVLPFLIAFTFIVSSDAQDVKKLMKEAKKEIGKYSSNATSNKANLDKAMSLLDQAFALPDAASSTEALTMKGDVYNEIADAAIKAQLLKPDFKSPVENATTLAADAYMDALKYTAKKGDTKDALKGLAGLEVALYNSGITEYQAQKLEESFLSFNKAIAIGKALNANGEKSRLDEPANNDEILYFAAIAGYQSGQKEEMLPLAEEMVKNGTDKSFAYQVLYEMYAETNPEKAEKYLIEGRTKFPDDSGLLFAEINNALKLGKLDELTGKLKSAIEKEPENITIYTTLGSVYEQLAAKSIEAKDNEKAEQYFADALSWYNSALQKSPESFEANYSTGAMYYNKAAKMASAVNEYANDYSAAGTKKYNEAKDKMIKAFDVALPYFIKAEGIKANDQNTLIALKEIYARTNKLEKSGEYKVKLENLGNK